MTRRQKAERRPGSGGVGRRLCRVAGKELPPMKHKVKHVHFVGIGGTAESREQGPLAVFARGCDRPRSAWAAGCVVSRARSCRR